MTDVVGIPLQTSAGCKGLRRPMLPAVWNVAASEPSPLKAFVAARLGELK
jgi:hypothetical protein